MLLSFCLFNTNQCISWLCVSVFSPALQTGYGIKLIEVNLAISAQQFLIIPGFILSAWMYTFMELKTIQMIAAVLTFLGGWLRMLTIISGDFWWVVVGCTIVGASAAFQMGGLNIIANDWFGDKERGLATALMTMSNPLGMLLGYTFQGIFITIMEKK